MLKVFGIPLINKNSLPTPNANDTALNKILTDFFIVLGAIAVLMIVVAGTRYIYARGNAEKITQAKNMILYSVVGLVLAALAASIVNIVIDRAG